jgi:cytochrome c oxidase subunit 2
VIGVRAGVRSLLATTAAAIPLVALVGWGALGPAGGVSDGAGRAGETPREIAVHVYAWGMSPRVIRVDPGESVRFVVSTDDIMHGFAINELGVNLALRPGHAVPSPAVTVGLLEGSYPIHCSVFCGLGHSAMKARLVVGRPGPAPASRAPWLASAAGLAFVAVFTAVAFRVAGPGR